MKNEKTFGPRYYTYTSLAAGANGSLRCVQHFHL
jgi:hypothetical protein